MGAWPVEAQNSRQAKCGAGKQLPPSRRRQQLRVRDGTEIVEIQPRRRLIGHEPARHVQPDLMRPGRNRQGNAERDPFHRIHRNCAAIVRHHRKPVQQQTDNAAIHIAGDRGPRRRHVNADRQVIFGRHGEALQNAAAARQRADRQRQSDDKLGGPRHSLPAGVEQHHRRRADRAVRRRIHCPLREIARLEPTVEQKVRTRRRCEQPHGADNRDPKEASWTGTHYDLRQSPLG